MSRIEIKPPTSALYDRIGNQRLRIRINDEFFLARDAKGVIDAEERAKMDLMLKVKKQCPACAGCSSLKIETERSESYYGPSLVGTLSCAQSRRTIGEVVVCQDSKVFTITSAHGDMTEVSTPLYATGGAIADAARIATVTSGSGVWGGLNSDSMSLRTPRETILNEFTKMAPNEQIDLLEWMNRMVKKRDDTQSKATMDRPVTEASDAW